MAKQNTTPAIVPYYGQPALGLKDGQAKPYRHVVDNFYGMGQDSFAQPPAQDPQTFMGLSNFLVSETGVLLPRWGTRNFYSLGPAFTEPFHLWSYDNPAGQITQNGTTTTGLKALLATSASRLTAFTDTASPFGLAFNPFVPSADNYVCNSRGWAYFSSDLKKLSVSAINVDTSTGTVSASNWGFAPPTPGSPLVFTTNTVSAASILQPTTLLNGWAEGIHVGDYTNGSLSSGPGVLSYANPANAYDSSVATAATRNLSNVLDYAGCVWGFTGGGTTTAGSVLQITSAVPTNGIETNDGYADIWYSWDGGTTWHNLYNESYRATTTDNITIPTSTLIADIQVMAFMYSDKYMKHSVYDIRVNQATGGTVVNGVVTLTTGRTYFYVYRNSATGHISGLSDPSTSTGAVSSGNMVLQGIAPSSDPQVDTIDILATADGNNESTLYLLASIPNGVTTYTDAIPEDVLLTQQIYLSTDPTTGLEFGCADNNPPPVGTYTVSHKGRLYLSVGRFLYFSKNITDITTSSGFPAGKFEEAFPPDYFLDLSGSAETITGLMSYGDLFIGTDNSVLRLSGDSPSNFSEPTTVFSNVGVASQESWQSLFLEGAPIGTAWLSPDKRVIFSDFNTFRDIGTPIQDVLNTINLSAKSSIRAQSLSLGAYSFYVLLVPTNNASQPTLGLVYNVRTQKWATWTFPTFSPFGLRYHVPTDSTPLNLICDGTNVYVFDATISQDGFNGVAGSAFPASFQTTWLDFGDPSYFKSLNEIEVWCPTGFTFTVEGANSPQDFAAPVALVSNVAPSPATTFTASMLQKLFLAGKRGKYRWYRITGSVAAPTPSSSFSGYIARVIPLTRF